MVYRYRYCKSEDDYVVLKVGGSEPLSVYRTSSHQLDPSILFRDFCVVFAFENVKDFFFFVARVVLHTTQQ